MKANEIRIGNWFHHNNEWCYRDMKHPFDFQFEEQDWMAVCECTLCLNNIEGIPITEDWLLKFGFVNNPLPERYAELGPINCMTIEKYLSISLEDGKWYPVRKYDGIQHIAYGIGLEYVHQLQNLYFALTGEELTIK